MYKIKTKAAGRIVAAAALSFGLAASAVGVASASSQGHHSRHHEGAFTSYQLNRVEGTVSAYVAAAGTANGSISILSKHSTTPVVYVTTPATTITGLAASATLASPDKVVLVLSTTTPVTVTSIKVKTPCAARVEGTVSAYVAAAGTANGSISILSHGSTTPVVYVTTPATTITGLAASATLASPDKVVLVLSTTTPVTVTSIKVKTPCAARVEGTVSAYVAAAGTANGSISILSHGSTTPVVYVTTPATTITGLAASATLASPDKVVLVLSTTTPVTVTSIFVAGHGSKCDGSKFGNEKSNDRSFGRGGAQTRDFGGRNFGGRNSSKHGHFWK
jgi:hypothetical protein